MSNSKEDGWKVEKAVKIRVPIRGEGEDYGEALIDVARNGGSMILALGGTGFAYKAVKDEDLSSALIAGLSWLGSAYLLSS